MTEVKGEDKPCAEQMINELKDDIEPSPEQKLEEELRIKQDHLLRLAADFDNFRKAQSREMENRVKYANEGLMLELLPALDNLEQAVKASGAENTDSVAVGVIMVLKQMNDVFSKYGVESFSALNKPFDPARHEAVGEKEEQTVEPGTVILEYQKGYLLNARLLRPARVLVAKAPAAKKE